MRETLRLGFDGPLSGGRQGFTPLVRLATRALHKATVRHGKDLPAAAALDQLLVQLLTTVDLGRPEPASTHLIERCFIHQVKKSRIGSTPRQQQSLTGFATKGKRKAITLNGPGSSIL